jgi:integrase
VNTRRKSTPSYLPHKQSGRARAVWTDALGVRQQKLLPGPFDSHESRAAFARLQLELAAAPLTGCQTSPATVSVNEVLLAHLEHAERHYRRADGTLTHEVDEYRLISRYVRELYGTTPAADFGPLALKAVRQKFITVGWCRTLINQRVGRVRRIFKWAASEQLVPASVHQALGTVQGLLKGRSSARESKPIEPVADAVVDATLPFLNRHVRGLVEFQRLTGCRPGEACALRWCDLDTADGVWVYRPPHHKTAWRGKDRSIAVGPKAQELLRAFRPADPTAPLFSPALAVAELHAQRGAERKTPRFPSHMSRNQTKRKRQPERTPAASYSVSSYGQAIDRACDKAFPPPGPLSRRKEESEAAWWGRLAEQQRQEVEAWRKSHRWHPNQLRHLFATSVRKAFGLEAAQVLLGHARADVTQVYAERNEELAAWVAGQVG